MGNFRTSFIIILLAATAFTTDFDRIVNYQGKLTDVAGVPIEAATNIEFQLWTLQVGGALIWSSGIISITPMHGLFSTTLDFGKDVNFKLYDELWLQAQVEGADLSNREKLTSVFPAVESDRFLGLFEYNRYVTALRRHEI